MVKSKPCYFLGIRGVHFIWHGQWADPELRYKKFIANYTDVTDSLWESYWDECEENGETPTNEGWKNWCRKHPWSVKNDIELFSEA